MDVFKIIGGTPLKGTVKVSGSKNAALPMFAATLLTGDTVTLTNVPNLSDLRFMAQILEHLGATVEYFPEQETIKVTAKNVITKAPYDMVRKMRASTYCMGALLGRAGHCEVSMPGGCAIGNRPIDLHLKGFQKMNCQVELQSGYVCIDGSKRRGADIFLGGRMGSTVGGTINVLMAAVLTPGTTRIQCAACEPEVDAVAERMVQMGAKIAGIGSPTLTITGVKELHGCEVAIIPDRIEAGTLMMAGAITGGQVTVQGCNPQHLGALFDKFEEMGVDYKIDDNDNVMIDGRGTRKPSDIVTLPYPAFPTDLQAQMLTLMCLTPGISVVTEKIYPNRFLHVAELQRLGANVDLEGATAIVKGVSHFSGAPLMASDLRASAALVMAGLAAEGTTWVQRIYHLDRGYDRLERKLSMLGAKIERLRAEDMPAGDATTEKEEKGIVIESAKVESTKKTSAVNV